MAAVTVWPYGSWKSPITTDLITGTSISLGQVAVDGETIYWTEGRPTEGGRYVIVRRTADGRIEDVTPAPLNARTRVHEYGGGAYVVDLAWLRTTPWRERLAASFDPPARRSSLAAIDGFTIRHQSSSTASALLLAGWLGRPTVARVFFLAGGAAAACWVRKADLLLAAVSPPTLLCIVLVVVSAVTGSGGLAVSAAEGTALTLAGAAPWLFAGTALPLTIAAARGLLGLAWPLRQHPSRPTRPAAARRGDAADGRARAAEREPDATRV